jgi:glycosyltransferase Alg8
MISNGQAITSTAPAIKNTRFHFNIKEILYLHCYLLFLLIALLNLPKSIWIYYETRFALIGIGIVGIWRYSWWGTHVIRSLIYGYLVFPNRRLRADKLWMSGWRPRQLFIMMTTFNEIRDTTEKVLETILAECSEINVPTKLFIGTGSEFDEQVIENYFAKRDVSFSFEVVMVRQKKPGKRYAIGETVRAIAQNGLEPDDPVIFMDGDTYFTPECLRKCLPFFPLHSKMQALTTYEQAIVLNGPRWMAKWLEMRFAQRDFTMQSYSLSNKIITLTGRMSIFRGKHILEPGFVEVIENDNLDHWLWGRFRFLSGDDKSTWYYLLKAGAEMFYIPDATTITIEYINGSPLDRMIENLRRWSGNTLRNGARAIALGPQRVGFFIWWCLLDQRISIWTMLVGHMFILILSFIKTIAFFLAAIIWIAFSRLCSSIILFFYARRIDMTFPFLLYCNQLISAILKVYILFRLPQQKWKNRGDQRSGFDARNGLDLKKWIANYLTAFYCVSFLLLILLYLGVVYMPTISDIKTLWL